MRQSEKMEREKHIDVKKIMAQERWNKRNARAYERHKKLTPKNEEQFWEDIIADYPINKNSVILDLGTGTGFLGKIILRRGLSVIGLDLSKHMLAIANKNAPDTRLVRGDAENIPLVDNSVDLIVSRWVLWTLPHPERALEEVVRVLRPDGCVMLCDGESTKTPGLTSITGRIRSLFMDIFIGRRFPTWKRVYQKLDPHLPRWDYEQISEKLRELGVEEIQVIHNINKKGSFLHKLAFYSEWEQFVVIFSNKV